MAAKALYLRWRPMTFEDIVGQEHITWTLRNALTGGRVGHAYLFAGPRGTGKTTMARLLAKAVNCLHEDPAVRPCNACAHCEAVNQSRFLDLIEIDAASHTGVDDVRDLRERIAFAPNEGQYKVYIIDEVHRFSGAAFDALLKTIEEPPAHAIFVLATTEIHKVPQTILSRCQRFDFRRFSLAQLVSRLRLILEAEGMMADDEALELVARQATGSMRDAISLLDQLIAGPDEVLTVELSQAILGTAANTAVRELTTALLYGNVGEGLDIINRAMDEGTDPRQFARQMVGYLRLVMLVQTGGEGLAHGIATSEEIALAAEHAAQMPRRALLGTLRAFNEAATDARAGWQPQLPLEMALVESVEARYASPEPEQAAPQQAPPAQPQNAAPQAAPAAEPEPAPQAAEEPPPPAPTVSAAEVQQRWGQVMQVTRQIEPAGVIQALLRSGGLFGVEGDVVILQMPGDVLCAKIEDDENREVIEAALQRVFNVPLRVRCRVTAGQDGPQQSDQVDTLLAEDSLASYLVNELGGRVSRIEDMEEE